MKKELEKMSDRELLIYGIQCWLRIESKIPGNSAPTLATLGFMSNDELMRLLKIGRATAAKLRNSGDLRYSKKGGLIFYKIDDVVEFLNSGFKRS